MLAGALGVESVMPGSLGNLINIEVQRNIPGAPNNGEVLVYPAGSGWDVIIRHGAAGITRAQIQTALDANPRAAALIRLNQGGGPADTAGTVARGALAGGTDADTKICLPWLRFMPSNENLIDSVEATMESKSFDADSMLLAIA